MKDVLIVVDMQNAFIDGALGTAEAVSIVPKVVEKVKSFPGTVIFTRDTHTEDYLSTQEGRRLPVVHCVKGTWGHTLADGLLVKDGSVKIEKPTFGSVTLGETVRGMLERGEIDSVELIGVCTDICVISNAMLLKAYCTELPVSVDASCCAGVTPQSHETALSAMRACQIDIES